LKSSGVIIVIVVERAGVSGFGVKADIPT
jgi:hypothetical protein